MTKIIDYITDSTNWYRSQSTIVEEEQCGTGIHHGIFPCLVIGEKDDIYDMFIHMSFHFR